MKVALILGISGQDGAYLAHLLLTKGYSVHGTSRDAEIASLSNLKRMGIAERVKIHSLSLGDFRGMLSLLSAVKPDEIYNLAGQSSVALSFEQPREAMDSIAIATMNTLECIRFYKAPVRFFNAVSSECFGYTPAPANESTAFRPRSPYAIAKAASFWETRVYREAYGMHANSAILSNHESPLRPERFVCRKIVATAVRIANGSKEPLVLGNTGVRRDWGLAAEYVQAIWMMLQRDEPGDFVIATGEAHSLDEFIAAVFDTLEMRASDHVVYDRALLRPLDSPEILLDPAKARNELQWQSRTRLKDLAAILVRCEQNRTVGPLPWASIPE